MRSGSEPALTVLLVEDDAMVRSWVRLSFNESEFRLAGEASTSAEAVDLVQRRRPDLLLVDYRLTDGVGTELVKELRRQNARMPAVLMTANVERGFNEVALEAGAQGSVLKTGSRDELLGALRAVAAGRRAFDARHPPRDAGRAALSPRERDVLRLVADGRTNREIASALDVGPETVKTVLGRIFVKLGVTRRAEAVSAAHRYGLL
jgi:DNA-binding NarL/FixJ family response regulator